MTVPPRSVPDDDSPGPTDLPPFPVDPPPAPDIDLFPFAPDTDATPPGLDTDTTDPIPPAPWLTPAGGAHPPVPPVVEPPGRGLGRLPLIVGVVLVAGALTAGAVAVFGGDETEFRWRGEAIADPGVTLEEAERALDAQVDDRHGALHDDARCYFSLPEDPDVRDVGDVVRCGPVLFVDGDPEAPYLSFALSSSGEGDDVILAVDEQPTDPQPTALDPGERLERPDGDDPPEGNGGLEPPAPPPAAEDLLEAIDLGPTEAGTAPESARIVSLNASYELTSLATIDRYGSGADARRAADGHRLIAFEVTEGGGEAASPSATPTVHVQIGDDEPRDVRPLVDASSTIVASVPEDAESVDLVVTDADVTQRLSLLDGTPGEDNLRVLTRANRSQTLGTAHQVTATGRDPGGSASVTGTITVEDVSLHWFLPDDPSKRASRSDAALLILHPTYNWSGVEPANAGLTPQVFTLTLPDGRVVEAANLAADPDSEVIVAFEVPADFTTGTVHIGGVDRQPTGLTIDFGAGVYDTGISIPEG